MSADLVPARSEISHFGFGRTSQSGGLLPKFSATTNSAISPVRMKQSVPPIVESDILGIRSHGGKCMPRASDVCTRHFPRGSPPPSPRGFRRCRYGGEAERQSERSRSQSRNCNAGTSRPPRAGGFQRERIALRCNGGDLSSTIRGRVARNSSRRLSRHSCGGRKVRVLDSDGLTKERER